MNPTTQDEFNLYIRPMKRVRHISEKSLGKRIGTTLSRGILSLDAVIWAISKSEGQSFAQQIHPRLLILRYFFVMGATLWIVSCGEQQQAADEVQTQEAPFDTAEWPQRVAVNAKATALLEKWPEYNAFEASFSALYDVENREELELVLDDLIEKQKLLAESGYPEAFDVPQVKSRQKVVQTYILKAKGDLAFRLDLDLSVREMIGAYNALRGQFNVIVNNTIDTDLILQE